MELWFARIERDVIASGIFTSVTDLKRKLMRYIRKYYEQRKPVKWKYRDATRRMTIDSRATDHQDWRRPAGGATAERTDRRVPADRDVDLFR